MSKTTFKKIAEENVQPKEFCFDKQNMILAKEILKIYPKNYKESSIMPLLPVAQNQNNGLSDDTTAKNNTSERITETAESSKKSIDDSALDIPAFLRR